MPQKGTAERSLPMAYSPAGATFTLQQGFNFLHMHKRSVLRIVYTLTDCVEHLYTKRQALSSAWRLVFMGHFETAPFYVIDE